MISHFDDPYSYYRQATPMVPPDEMMMEGPNLPSGEMMPGSFFPVGQTIYPDQTHMIDLSSPQTPSTNTTEGLVVGQLTEYTQGYLKTQIGKRVRMEFLVGMNTMQDRTGVLMEVGITYVVLRDLNTNDDVVCDLYSIKFVTFYD